MLGKLTLCCVYSSVLTTEGKPGLRELLDSVEGKNGNQGIIESGCGFRMWEKQNMGLLSGDNF